MAEEKMGIRNSDCSEADLMRLIFRGKWRIPILLQAVRGPVRLSELQRQIPVASKKMLIESLRALEGFGCLVRTDHGGILRNVDYRIPMHFEVAVNRALAAIATPSGVE